MNASEWLFKESCCITIRPSSLNSTSNASAVSLICPDLVHFASYGAEGIFTSLVLILRRGKNEDNSHQAMTNDGKRMMSMLFTAYAKLQNY